MQQTKTESRPKVNLKSTEDRTSAQPATKVHHFNTKFIILNAKFIIFNAKFIVFNAKFTDLTSPRLEEEGVT